MLFHRIQWIAMQASDPGLAPLLDRTLVLIAHADDEVIGCGALLQRMKTPVVVLATDGAPRDDYFWRRHGSREAYAQVREDEARKALAEVGVDEPIFLAHRNPVFVDQELFRVLPLAFDALLELAHQHRPSALLTLAYEGGHPDHDSCCFLTAQLARELKLPAWEMPLYHRSLDGLPVKQEFASPNGPELVLHPTMDELERKRRMIAAYSSQGDLGEHFNTELERFRPLADYDFSRPPLPGVLNYEAWQWPITGVQVAEHFSRFDEQRKQANLA
jgi:LmbE family N-acetylglucosaminyl deacetylase